MTEILIIGGGASGMAAAVSAADTGAGHVTLLERQARVGRKLLSTGNGRCNLTNTDLDIRRYHGTDPGFAEPALERFGPRETLDFFAGLGLLTEEEYGGRVYPMSNQANSVVDTLRFALDERGVEVITGAAVESVKREKGGFTVSWDGGERRCDRLIVACGGCAGSKLGGVMDGYNILKSLGHSRTALHPALTQVRTDTLYPRALKGIKAEAGVKVLRGSRTIAERRGELLFTETGVSGTVIFELSRAVATGGEGLELSLDFFPDRSGDFVVRYLQSKAEAGSALPANQIFTGTVHNRLGQMLCKAAGIDGNLACAGLERRQLEAAARMAKDFRLKITGVSGFESAQVTAGGISTAEFDPYTLESRLVPGLYACGEVLDIDGDCGGYNLQWAWASGRTAGRIGK